LWIKNRESICSSKARHEVDERLRCFTMIFMSSSEILEALAVPPKRVYGCVILQDHKEDP
jgi:hypothetical protein